MKRVQNRASDHSVPAATEDPATISNPTLAYTTALGRAYKGDSRALLMSAAIEPASVDLLMMSPPFALTRKKDYGNESADRYVDWFVSFVKPFLRVLKPTGSIVIDIGGAYLPGRPQR